MYLPVTRMSCTFREGLHLLNNKSFGGVMFDGAWSQRAGSHCSLGAMELPLLAAVRSWHDHAELFMGQRHQAA